MFYVVFPSVNFITLQSTVSHIGCNVAVGRHHLYLSLKDTLDHLQGSQGQGQGQSLGGGQGLLQALIHHLRGGKGMYRLQDLLVLTHHHLRDKGVRHIPTIEICQKERRYIQALHPKKGNDHHRTVL